MELNRLTNDSTKEGGHPDVILAEKQPKVGGVQRICTAFLESSTTIPAVTLVYQRISIVWKILWFIIAIIGLTVSIYQSVELVKNYLAYPSNLVEVEKVNRTVYFPSITLCAKNTVNWRFLNDLDIIAPEEDFKEIVEMYLKQNHSMYEIRLLLEHNILAMMQDLGKEFKKHLLFGPKQWFKGCLIQKFGGQLKSCSDEHTDFLVEVYSPYYGACITINPGFPDGYRFRDDSRTSILILTETPDESDFPYLPHLSGMLVSIHSPGSAPVLPFNKKLTIVPGTWMQLTTTVYDLIRLPHPYAANCTNDDSSIAKEVRNFSPYRDGIKPHYYSYSREECLGMCFQTTMVNQKKCINPFMAINDEMESIQEICGADIMTDDYMAELERECAAKCQMRCHEFLYEWIPVTQKVPQEDGYLIDFMSHINPESRNLANDSNYYSDVVSLISLNMDTGIHIVGTEVAKIELEDVFGAVGGNLGLWIGISMLSVFEVLELIAQLIAHGCHRLNKYFKRSEVKKRDV